MRRQANANGELHTSCHVLLLYGVDGTSADGPVQYAIANRSFVQSRFFSNFSLCMHTVLLLAFEGPERRYCLPRAKKMVLTTIICAHYIIQLPVVEPGPARIHRTWKSDLHTGFL